MMVYWERLGLLGPIYRMVGRGLSDCEIASQLKLTEFTVHSCVGWMLRFLKLEDRAALILYASASPPAGCRLGLPAAA